MIDRIAKTSADTNRTQPGIEVTYPNGAKSFFPGGIEQMAMAFAMLGGNKDKLSDPLTQIEFGFRSGGEFFSEKVTKHKMEPKPTTPTKR